MQRWLRRLADDAACDVTAVTTPMDGARSRPLMTAEQADSFLTDMARALDERVPPVPVVRGQIVTHPLTGELVVVGYDLVEHAEWLAGQDWADSAAVAEAVDAVEREHYKPWCEVVEERAIAFCEYECARLGRETRGWWLIRRARAGRGQRIEARPRARSSHGRRPGHRRVVSSRAGPDDDPAEPAEPARVAVAR